MERSEEVPPYKCKEIQPTKESFTLTIGDGSAERPFKKYGFYVSPNEANTEFTREVVIGVPKIIDATCDEWWTVMIQYDGNDNMGTNPIPDEAKDMLPHDEPEPPASDQFKLRGWAQGSEIEIEGKVWKDKLDTRTLIFGRFVVTLTRKFP